MTDFAGASVPVEGCGDWRPDWFQWNALEPDQRARAAFHAAKRAHPLACSVLDIDPAAREASSRPYWLVKTRDFGNGHREALVMKVHPDPFGANDRWLERDMAASAPRGQSEEREDNIERAVRRAKAQVRTVCKSLGVNSLWTLTYRANVTDRDVVLRHLDRFRRAVAAALPGWRYVAVLERQERGAYHIHLATHALPVYLVRGGVRLKSWNVMRGVWRSVVGDLGGNFDEAKRRTRWGGSKGRSFKGAGGIAAYLAGYVAKDMHESPLNRKRFTRSQGVEIPAAVRAIFAADVSMRELVELAYAAVGDRVSNAWFSGSRDLFWVATDDTVTPILGPS